MRTFGQADRVSNRWSLLILLIFRFRNNFFLFFQNQANKNNCLWQFIDDNYLKVFRNENRKVKDERRKEVLVFYFGLEPFLLTLLLVCLGGSLTCSPHYLIPTSHWK